MCETTAWACLRNFSPSLPFRIVYAKKAIGSAITAMSSRHLSQSIRTSLRVRAVYSEAAGCPAGRARARIGGGGLLQRGHVDDESVLDVALEHPLVGLVDLLDRDGLDVRGDLSGGAEI